MVSEPKQPSLGKVFVALSGGVDSAVSAGLLKQAGYEVTGIYFKPWQPEHNLAHCRWQEDRRDALRVAVKLGIRFETWDFSADYHDRVVNYMISAYKKGQTPNPDIICNDEIKFGLFLEKSRQAGADFIATGHYAQIKKSPSGKFQLLMGADPEKDQSYFLYKLTQAELAMTLFPVGHLKKTAVRKLAEKLKLPVATKKDSQGVCFVGDLSMREFLKEYIQPRPGDIKNTQGEVIGRHEGIAFYTIGQRHGFTTKNNRPYYVVGKKATENVLIVGLSPVIQKEIKIRDLTLIDPEEKISELVKTRSRYRQKLVASRLKNDQVIFLENQESPSPGQSIVFYQENRVLGGAIIND
ncbi:MAG: tRNA 2-thiouridine(34) synthase MnmA [Candidatus Yanofskybacteria bacterium CG10_big_fil_rev_8_21_14_0_10_46_23]|uniref:tRNA-specific 2-thiouridylase MnmA n=1 Tax=Candidatus Yanofskybacteria bacterium CG10_big_fil_rev_8_21_14_0_10_46_23 TaxID=1975098 RepID=A0A2H0R4M8_9BACT|nr:MAG: tRNA 2-thiouridine(34) synthase MnmA [Candidatus Yanofskybacteria bacterium CG10_big_fil_rev_8_21_14_0_10_46_23]